jgi:hypothetical protein
MRRIASRHRDLGCLRLGVGLRFRPAVSLSHVHHEPASSVDGVSMGADGTFDPLDEGLIVLPVFSVSPSGSVTAPEVEPATASGAGSTMSCPFASFQTPGAKNTAPCASRTIVQGEKKAPAGATATHRPGLQAHFRPRHTHSPPIHTAAAAGSLGMNSTRAGGGGKPTGTSASVRCCTYGGWGSRLPHAKRTRREARPVRRMSDGASHDE